MAEEKDWKIEKVDQKRNTVTVKSEGEIYIFTLKNKKIVCLSDIRLDEKIFSVKRTQLYAILARIPSNRLKGRNQEESKRLESLEEFGCYILGNGKLVINYNRDGKIIPSTYEDIASAIRAQEHINNKYLRNTGVAEFFRLFSKLEKLEKVRKVLFDWKNSTPEEISRAEDELNGVADKLKNCRDLLKKEAAQQLEKLIDFTDSSGKKNPGASLACTQAGKSRIEERTVKIKGIDQFVFKRSLALNLEQRQMEFNIIEAIFKLKAVLNSGNKFFENKKGADTKLGLVMYALQSVWLNPYFEKIAEIRKDILEAKLKISKNEIARAKTFIAGAISKLSCIQ